MSRLKRWLPARGKSRPDNEVPDGKADRLAESVQYLRETEDDDLFGTIETAGLLDAWKERHRTGWKDEIVSKKVTISLPRRYWLDLINRGRASGLDEETMISTKLIWEWPELEDDL